MKVPSPMVIVVGIIRLESPERFEPSSIPPEQLAQTPTQIFPSLRVWAVGCESMPISPIWVDIARAGELTNNEKHKHKQTKGIKRSIDREEPLLEMTNQMLLTLGSDKINGSFTLKVDNLPDIVDSVRQLSGYSDIRSLSALFLPDRDSP